MHPAAWVIHQDTPDQYHVIESVQTPQGAFKSTPDGQRFEYVETLRAVVGPWRLERQTSTVSR